MKQIFILITAAILLAGCASLGDETSGASGKAGEFFSDPSTDIYLGGA